MHPLFGDPLSRHFFISEESIQGRSAFLTPEESHHLRSVLRKKIGDTLHLLTGKGKVYEGKINKLEPQVEIEILSSKLLEEATSPLLVLCPAVLKNNKMDWLIEKATELGIHRILPFESQRGVVKIDENAKKIARWERISLAALKQSGRGLAPQIGPYFEFDELLQYASKLDALKLIFSLEDVRAVPLSQLSELARNKGECSSWIFLIGPEGGFSPLEEKKAQEAGFQLCSLGKYTLRAETAGITALSILKFLRESLQ